MVEKPKRKSTKPRPPPKMTKAEQLDRFIKTARELGVDETGAEFERLFAKVSRVGRRTRSIHRKGE